MEFEWVGQGPDQGYLLWCEEEGREGGGRGVWREEEGGNEEGNGEGRRREEGGEREEGGMKGEKREEGGGMGEK